MSKNDDFNSFDDLSPEQRKEVERAAKRISNGIIPTEQYPLLDEAEFREWVEVLKRVAEYLDDHPLPDYPSFVHPPRHDLWFDNGRPPGYRPFDDAPLAYRRFNYDWMAKLEEANPTAGTETGQTAADTQPGSNEVV